MNLRARIRAGLVSMFLAGGLCLAFPVDVGAVDGKAWIGVSGGLSVPNKSDTSPRPILGVNLGAKLGSEFSIGAHFLTSSKDESVSGMSVPWNYQLYGVSGAYHFEGEAEGVYLGALIGMSRMETKALGGDLATSPMHWGVMAGYDYPMAGDMFSLGGELSFISISGASGSVHGVSRETDAFSILNFILTLKFWL